MLKSGIFTSASLAKVEAPESRAIKYANSRPEDRSIAEFMPAIVVTTLPLVNPALLEACHLLSPMDCDCFAADVRKSFMKGQSRARILLPSCHGSAHSSQSQTCSGRDYVAVADAIGSSLTLSALTSRQRDGPNRYQCEFYGGAEAAVTQPRHKAP